MAHEQEGQVISCHTVESWNEQLQKGFEYKKLIVVDFTATWCAPCRFIEPIFNELARKMPYAIFLKVDVNELKSFPEDCAVEVMPTFMLMKGGKIVGKILGAKEDELLLAVAKHATADA